MRPSKKVFAAFVHMNSVNNTILKKGNEIRLYTGYNVYYIQIIMWQI
jgi:hypothetical protein